MEFRFEGAVADVMPGIQLLLDELGVELEEDGIPVEVALSDGDLEVGRTETTPIFVSDENINFPGTRPAGSTQPTKRFVPPSRTPAI